MDQLAKPTHVKSCSRRNFSSDQHQHQSPTSVLIPPMPRISRRLSGGRKSLTLTELELEELKGFMDLGFKFSKEDQNDHNLVSIVPGLRRVPGEIKNIQIQRPYLSEVWEVMEKNEAVMESTSAINRRIGEIGCYNDQSEMKEQIKLWARSVASAIR